MGNSWCCQTSLKSQLRSKTIEVDRLSKDKVALELQLAELRARYSKNLADDISTSYEQIQKLARRRNLGQGRPANRFNFDRQIENLQAESDELRARNMVGYDRNPSVKF